MAAFLREKKSRKSAFAIDRFPVSLVSSPFKILSQKFDHCIKRQKYTEIGRINLHIKSKKGIIPKNPGARIDNLKWQKS